MNFFRGDTFLKKITSEYQFRVGDKIEIVVMQNAYARKYLFNKTIEIKEETNEFNFEILPSETEIFPIGTLLLEIQLTTVDGKVVTQQYSVEVKADGIYGRN